MAARKGSVIQAKKKIVVLKTLKLIMNANYLYRVAPNI
jgi:hypothetical protein